MSSSMQKFICLYDLDVLGGMEWVGKKECKKIYFKK